MGQTLQQPLTRVVCNIPAAISGDKGGLWVVCQPQEKLPGHFSCGSVAWN